MCHCDQDLFYCTSLHDSNNEIISVTFSYDEVHCYKYLKVLRTNNPNYDDNEVLGGTLVHIEHKQECICEQQDGKIKIKKSIYCMTREACLSVLRHFGLENYMVLNKHQATGNTQVTCSVKTQLFYISS